ncbi:uncharacterized protein MYCFIDRAFT_170231 [Pseudocercospora fijiensis CIRAD86]|uniref:Uncharacterized protein n=1 Tax=Pseudocercospora fijiensis (strain CIRAD86) TaxID=383855 RepID=N1QA49_PSEFD|nr:uncharacterized protein MYCFIDRAFT_170231 [Pseudocercospora fijiensis CIRAD86]EME88636.1 hypothetical protein MYCFIDRAFT_170231 [Pseudocercospora fijiensis CIRAD86]
MERPPLAEFRWPPADDVCVRACVRMGGSLTHARARSEGLSMVDAIASQSASEALTDARSVNQRGIAVFHPSPQVLLCISRDTLLLATPTPTRSEAVNRHPLSPAGVRGRQDTVSSALDLTSLLTRKTLGKKGEEERFFFGIVFGSLRPYFTSPCDRDLSANAKPILKKINHAVSIIMLLAPCATHNAPGKCKSRSCKAIQESRRLLIDSSLS